MAITPHSTIYLCYVPIDNSYKNQIYFVNKNEQTAYFLNKKLKTYNDYSYIRRDGKTGIRVANHIDELTFCNYVMYRNENYTDRYFYAFITEMKYVNDRCTEIMFETDCYQTWRFDIDVRQSFVVREHSMFDDFGGNVVPEDFSFNDYKLKALTSETLEQFTNTDLTTWGYLVGTTEQRGSDGSRGKMMSGIYQGLYFYYYENTNNLNDFLDEIEEEGGDCVQFICCIPRFCVTGNSVGGNETDMENGEGWLYYSGEPAKVDFEFPKNSAELWGDMELDGTTTLKNKKCFTSQFFSILVTNNAGTTNEYSIDKWSTENIRFRVYGDVSANPSVMLVPLNYNGVGENFDESVTLAGFPQCSFNSDSFKLWLSRNQYALGVSAVGTVAQIAGGVMSGNPLITAMGVNGALDIAGQIANVAGQSKEPNRLHAGNTRNNLLTACKANQFKVFVKYLKPDFMKMVDDYFTMFGYKTNRVKYPQMSSRPYFNYVQTVDVNIIGAIPNDDMKVIKNMFNNGVTLWQKNATVGDYSVDNSPNVGIV